MQRYWLHVDDQSMLKKIESKLQFIHRQHQCRLCELLNKIKCIIIKEG